MAESSNVHGRRGSVTRVVPPAGRRTQAWLDLATKGAPVAGPGGRAEGIFTNDADDEGRRGRTIRGRRPFDEPPEVE